MTLEEKIREELTELDHEIFEACKDQLPFVDFVTLLAYAHLDRAVHTMALLFGLTDDSDVAIDRIINALKQDIKESVKIFKEYKENHEINL